MDLSVCVYSSSSAAVAAPFFAAAEELGTLIARRKDTLVFGGSHVGLMGAVARSVHLHGGRVIGVIPQVILDLGIAYAEADELIVTQDLRERKAIMDRCADAFIALPGGFGTLEEMFEIMTLKQLDVHVKPIVFINTGGFYDPLLQLFEHIYDQQFAKPQYRELYHIVPDAQEAFAYIDTYQPPVPVSKIF